MSYCETDFKPPRGKAVGVRLFTNRVKESEAKMKAKVKGKLKLKIKSSLPTIPPLKSID